MSRSKLPQGWYAKYATLKPIPSPAPVQPGPTPPEAGAGSAAEALEGEAPPMLRITIRFEPSSVSYEKRLRWLLKHAKRALGIDVVEIAPFPTHRPKEATSGKETRTPTKDQTPPATEAAQHGGRVDQGD